MEVVMPKVGLTMTEGTIVEWHKREGDAVSRGEVLFTFETEKSTLESESPDNGVLSRILVPAGQTVACLTPVAVLGEWRESVSSSDERGRQPSQDAGRRPMSPRARMRARELGIDLDQITGTGPNGAIRERDVQLTNTNLDPGANRVTPVAQRLALEFGIDPGTIQGTGPDGRVTRADVEREARDRAREGGRSISGMQSLSPARRVTALRMAANAQAAPHVTLTTEADATELVSARNQITVELNATVSYNALLVAICARALREHPGLNASWIDGQSGGIVVHDAIHIGLAVDTPRGLFVPVIRECGGKPLKRIHDELTEVMNRALEGRSRPDDLAGGTFTLTNLGMFEIDAFTPILNLPEAAILGVGRIAAKPVAVGDQIALRQMMALSLSFDHRVVDGAPAARFLQRIKQLIERPFALML
jgi:pyruvate dehydrogenase E2 component (dihydrolipoamide acetyltransferase)